jgi:PAS domain S-box-containing protein
MKKSERAGDQGTAAAELRRKAEQRMAERQGKPLEELGESDVRALVQELQVHRIELEMQNEELLRAQAAAEEVSRKYAELFDFAPTAYFLWDERGTIREVNLAGAALLGVDRSAAVDRRFGQFVVLEDRPEFAAFCQRAVVADAKQTCQFKLLQGAEVAEVVIEGVAVAGREGKVRLCRAAVIDITDRLRAERALTESREHYRSLFTNLLDGCAYCEMLYEEGKPQDFVYLDVNPAFEKLTGLKDAVGKKVSEVIPGIRRANPELFETYGRVAASGSAEKFETYLDALGIWFSIAVFSPRKGHFVAVFEDITARKRMDQERQIAIEFLHLINASAGTRGLVEATTRFFQEQSGCEAVGIRLCEGDDYPYYETRGFSKAFVLAENTLCVRWENGEPQYGGDGNPVLDCMCGNVICGRFNPAKPYFTPGGSFWTNCTTELSASTTEADRPTRSRNRCNREGYESVALLRLHSGNESLGLLQLADRRKGVFTRGAIIFWERLAGYFAVALAKSRAEEKLRESEDRYHSLFNTMTEGFALHEIICDEHGEACDYRFLDVNPGFEQLTGLKHDALIGKTMREVLPGEHFHWIKTYGAVALTGKSARFEGHSAAIGSYYDVYAYCPAPRQFAVMFTDITERKRSEEAVREIQERWTHAANAAQIGMFDWNVLTGKVAWSQQCEFIFGYTPSAAMTTIHDYRDWADRVHPEDLSWVEERIRRCMTEQTPYEIEHRVVWPDGSVHWVAGQGRTQYDAEGRAIRRLGTVVDVTERKRAEQERLEMELRLFHAQKLESLGVLAGGIAHDFNNILAGIIGYADLAKAHLSSCELAHEDIEVIKKAAQRAADLTRQMLAYSGKGKFIVEPLNLSQVVEDSKKMLAIMVSKKAAVTYDLASDLPAIRGDAGQIGQILMNFVSNASEALGEQGGAISISTDAIQCSAGELAAMGCEAETPACWYVRLEVADTGCGMEPQTLSKIFDPFFTTKFTGRGLGLAAVHGIVRSHKGAIRVASEPGKGTTFQVLLPVSADALPSTAIQSVSARGWRGSGTVLVVDDEEIIRNVARSMLEQLGFSVVTADDGQAAVRLYQRRQDEIVCVLLDLTMPKMGGNETFHALRRIRSDVRVILSSGFGEEGATEQFGGMDLAGFIQKPYQLDTMIARFREALEGSSVCQAPGNAPAGFRNSAAIAPAPPPAAKDSAGADRKPAGNTVLVVDDDEMVRTSTQVLFEMAGFSVLTAEDGAEALRRYDEHQDQIVCVYLDLIMPKMGGEETLRELRRRGAQVRVILASGYREGDVAGRFADLGVWRFLHKLSPLDEVIAKLREALADGDRLKTNMGQPP